MPSSRSSFPGRTTRLLLLATASVCVVPVLAEQREVIFQPVLEGQPPAKENVENVFVRDSATARDKFDLAKKMEGYKEWNKAADLYQEVLEKYPDRVVPDGQDPTGTINRYTSVTWGVMEKLSKWPQPGLDVYRGMYEPRAAQLLDQAKADDMGVLHKVFRLYFVTESGKLAGMRLIDAHLENGEYSAAARIGDQLLDMYPKDRLLIERPAVLFRTALAYHLAGQGDKAKDRATALETNFAQEMGVVRGKDVVLAEALGQELKQIPVASRLAHTDSVMTFGGNGERSLVSTAKASAGTPLFKVLLAKPDYRGLNGQQKLVIQNQMEVQSSNGMTIGVFPTVDRGELFFQDGSRVYAVSLASGVPLAGWLQNGQPYMQGGQYVLRDAQYPARLQQQTLTLTERSVLGVMGQQDRQVLMAMGIATTGGESRLVCLDRATGAERWVVSLTNAPDVPKNDDEKAIRALQLSGSPLVVGDNVLVIGRNVRQGQGEDCYVVAFDLNTGKYRWGCYVASSGVGPGAMFGVPGSGDSTSHLAYANGRVYCLTNLGAVAALDAYSGTIVWLNIYPLDQPMMAAGGRGFNPRFTPGGAQGTNRLKPWQLNPVAVSDGAVFVLPTEGKYLMVYDAGSGREIKRINLDQLANWTAVKDNSWNTDRPDTLVGILGDKMVLCGDRRVLCINWKKYEEATFPGPKDEMIHWPSVVRGAIRGRPFLTADSVFVPTDERLVRLAMSDGRGLESYPSHTSGWRAWEEGDGPGNVLVSGDHVVLAGADSIDVYTDLAVAKARLDGEVANAPTDPDPRLRYAEVMFVAGQHELALQRLDEAIQLLGGLEAMRTGGERDRVFHDALTFAVKSALVAGEDRPSARERAVKLFDRAGYAASSPQQHVHYRVARAKFVEGNKDIATAVRFYQEVLSNDQMRLVSLADAASASSSSNTAGNPVQAQDVAEKAIESLIRVHGPAVYEPYQKQAADAMASAQDEQDLVAKATRLQAVAQTFPNSGVAPKAMLAAADAYESATQPRSAIRVLRQMWFKNPSGPVRMQVLEGIARNYLAVPDRNRGEMISTAAARLAQGTQLPGDPKLTRPLKLPDGTVVADAGTSFLQALDDVRRLSSKEAGKTLPDFGLPKPPTPAEKLAGAPYPSPFLNLPVEMKPKVVSPQMTRPLPEAQVLVLPARDFARPDRVVTWSPAAMSIFASGQDKPLATYKGFSEAGAAAAPRGVAWVGDTALVWGGSKLVSLDAHTAKPLWELDLAKLPSIEVVRAGDAGGPAADPIGANNVVIINGQQVFLNDARLGGGRVVVRGGLVVNNRPVQVGPVAVPANQPVAQPAAPIDGAGEQVAELRPVGDRVLVATTAGRLLSVEVGGNVPGRIAWQARLAESWKTGADQRVPERLVATEDFTVVRVSDDLNARLFALDTFTGKILGSKSFSLQTNVYPVNLALSADGTLVYTLPDRLCLKDLYKGWTEEEKVVGQPGQPMFAGASQIGQLLIAEGRILALADNGNEKYVRIHSLETGQPIQLRFTVGDGAKQEVPQSLTSGAKDWNVMLRTVGPYLYIVGSQTVYGYNLDKPSETWKGMTNTLTDVPQNDVNLREAFIGQGHLVVLDQPPQPAGGAPQYRLHAFGRDTGRLDYSVTVTDPLGVAPQWQATDGGFYYATQEGKVRLLAGAKKAAK